MTKANILKLLQKDSDKLYDDKELCIALGAGSGTKEHEKVAEGGRPSAE